MAAGPYPERVYLVLVCAGILAVAGVVALLLMLRRDGGRSEDLVAGQMRAVADPRSALAGPAGPVEAPGEASPGTPHEWDALDEQTRRRVEQFVATGARLRAINLIRESAGWSLSEAKAVVDGLGATPPAGPGRPGTSGRTPGAPVAVPPRRGRPAGAGDPGPRRPAQFPPGFDIDPGRPARAQRGEARGLLEQALELAHSGRPEEAVRLLHERAAMSVPEARAALTRLGVPRPE